MNLVSDTASINSRIALIALSSVFVALPQILWTIFGYGGVLSILLESALIICSFLLLLFALETTPRPLIRKIAGLFADNGEEQIKPKRFKKYLAFLAIPYFLVPYGISMLAGYNQPSLFLLILIASITAICIAGLLHLDLKKSVRTTETKLYTVLLLALGLVWAFSFWIGTPKFPTDEFALDYYAAHQFLLGINPYVPSNMAGLYGFLKPAEYGFPYNIATPYLTGGIVTSLTYPALSFLVYIPAQLISAYPSAIMIPFYAIVPLVVYRSYSRSGFSSIALIPAFIILLNPSYLNQVSLGYPDILWVLFTSLSIYTFKKPGRSGLFLGIAAAIKQIPWLVIPFFLIFIFKESGAKASAKWLISASGIFFLINLPFIILGPSAFFNAILGPEFQQLVGIGFGPSQISFLAILPISKIVFSSLVVTVLIASIIVYFVQYKKLKFTFLAFPIIIFLFNYRLLLNYVIFWPIIALGLLPILHAEKMSSPEQKLDLKKWKKPVQKIAVPMLLVAIIMVPIAFQINSYNSENTLGVSSATVTSTSGMNVTGMSVAIAMNSSLTSPSNLQFRILPFSASHNMNGYLWKTDNYSKVSNGSFLLNIIPQNESQAIGVNGSYRIIAYYGGISGGEVITLQSGLVK